MYGNMTDVNEFLVLGTSTPGSSPRAFSLNRRMGQMAGATGG